MVQEGGGEEILRSKYLLRNLVQFLVVGLDGLQNVTLERMVKELTKSFYLSVGLDCLGQLLDIAGRAHGISV